LPWSFADRTESKWPATGLFRQSGRRHILFDETQFTMKSNHLFDLLKDTYREWSAVKASRLGASLAYYSVFSIAPLLMMAVAMAGLIYGPQAARGEVFDEIKNIVGAPAAHAIEGMLAQDSSKAGSTSAAIFSFGLLIIGASGVFIHLQDALNTIWR